MSKTHFFLRDRIFGLTKNIKRRLDGYTSKNNIHEPFLISLYGRFIDPEFDDESAISYPLREDLF